MSTQYVFYFCKTPYPSFNVLFHEPCNKCIRRSEAFRKRRATFTTCSQIILEMQIQFFLFWLYYCDFQRVDSPFLHHPPTPPVNNKYTNSFRNEKNTQPTGDGNSNVIGETFCLHSSRDFTNQTVLRVDCALPTSLTDSRNAASSQKLFIKQRLGFVEDSRVQQKIYSVLPHFLLRKSEQTLLFMRAF